MGDQTVHMRLHIMTALYMPILGYAMMTFDLNPEALIIRSDNLEAHAVPVERTVPVGDMFSASIYYELVPTEEQQETMQEMKSGEGEGESGSSEEDGHAKGVFQPSVIVNEEESPEGMYYDSVDKKIYFNTAKVFENEPADKLRKELDFQARIEAQTAKGVAYSRKVEESFTVFRPTIQVQSNITPRLMANCRNSLSFTVPGVPATDIVLEEQFSGRTFSSNSMTWAPTSDTASVSVYRQTEAGRNKVGERGFKITKPPLPTVGLREAGDDQFLRGGDQIDLTGNFELVVKADENFMQEFPQDASYRIDGMKVEISRSGLVPIEEEFDRQQLQQMLDLSGQASGEFVYEFSMFDVTQNPQGSGISIYIRDISRLNYNNQRVPIDLNNVPSQFTFKAE